MNIKTALVAWNCRLREWAGMIQDCKRHPEDMSVKQWCDAHSITVANYYCQMKEVRKPLLMRSVECWLHTKPAAVPKVINGRLCFSGIMLALRILPHYQQKRHSFLLTTLFLADITIISSNKFYFHFRTWSWDFFRSNCAIICKRWMFFIKIKMAKCLS